MLLEFKVKNFRSISNWETFSMLAENKVKEHSDAIIFENDFNLLKSAVIYGRNAAGKSNLLDAIRAIQYLVLKSADYKVNQVIEPYEPFKLDLTGENEPIEFAIDFIAADKIRYIYSIGFNRTRITYEKLTFYPKGQSAILFDRIADRNIKYGEYLTGRKKDIEDSLYPNQLFLSKIGTEKNEKLSSAYTFFSEFLFTSTFHDTEYDDSLINIFSKKLGRNNIPFFRENINNLMRVADTGIQELTIVETKPEAFQFPKEMTDEDREKIIDQYKYKIRTIHKKFDGNKEIGNVEFKLNEESTGTIKLLAMGGLIIEALASGQVLIIDELDKSLHPKLTRALIKLFHCKKNNPKNAQLIFATHDISLLDSELFRRDQVWFAEKEFEGYSHYYSVSDIPGVRANVPYEKWYMSGKFGATPVINDNEFSFQF